jgi:glycosyltransferase involved in cell wall biosynthesis
LNLGLNAIGFNSQIVFTDEQFSKDSGSPLLRPCYQFLNRLSRSFFGRISKRPFHSFLFTISSKLDGIGKGTAIHFHGINGAVGPRRFLECIPENSPVFWTIHDMWPLTGGCLVYNGCNHFESKCRGCPALKAPFQSFASLDQMIKQKICRKIHIQPIANSSWTAKQISRSAVFSYVKDVPVVHPIMASEFKPFDARMVEKNPTRSKFRLALGARAITDEFKGIPQFLKALAGRPSLSRRVEVLLFGDGNLEALRGVQMESRGVLETPEEMADFFRGVDFFISPSRMETFGMAVAEAQACGVRVMAFDVGGVGDAVHPDGGVLVKDNDFGGLLDALEQEMLDFYSDSARRLRVAAEIQFQFSAKRISEKQRAIYECATRDKYANHQ